MAEFELAELNISRLVAPLESPELADFVANLERINAIAEASPGFVWRLQGEGGDATALRPFGDEFLVNLTVWRDLDCLRAYVYRSAHAEIMKGRRRWFHPAEHASTVLWWAPKGRPPTVAEAKARLDLLRAAGASRAAFTFQQPFPPPDESASSSVFVASLPDALQRGPAPPGNLAVPIFAHGSLEIELYTPRGADRQTPHARDEVYVVARGHGALFDGEERRKVAEGSVAFVPAGREHRFEEFSDDFAVWVMFYGPQGGEEAG